MPAADRPEDGREGGAEVLEAILAGQAIAATDYYFRVIVTFETSSSALAYLQDSLLVAAAAARSTSSMTPIGSVRNRRAAPERRMDVGLRSRVRVRRPPDQ